MSHVILRLEIFPLVLPTVTSQNGHGKYLSVSNFSGAKMRVYCCKRDQAGQKVLLTNMIGVGRGAVCVCRTSQIDWILCAPRKKKLHRRLSRVCPP